MCRYCPNKYVKKSLDFNRPEFEFLEREDILPFHSSIDGYRKTPLVRLKKLADSLGVAEIYVKDESHRFNLKSFKPLGASYAIFRFLKRKYESDQSTKRITTFSDLLNIGMGRSYTFTAATDGNHGKAVAWTARKLAQKAVIYLPEDTAKARVRNISDEGAQVILVSGTFDDCVEKCAEDSRKKNWQVIADTTYQGYDDIPKYILLGYTTLFKELEHHLHDVKHAGIDMVLLPAGVGGLAAAGTSYYVKKYGSNRPLLICVEPNEADCYFESVRRGDGKPLPSRGRLNSIMVGLNCGIPSSVAWPIIRDGMHMFITISDRYAEQAMRLYAQNDIVSGESGASGLAGLLALLEDNKLLDAKKNIGLTKSSRILLINTEGDTDPVRYNDILANRGHK
jgi:diaminopropionate ammonia-lyase